MATQSNNQTVTDPNEYLYPMRRELLEEVSGELRAALARVSQNSRQAFMAELTAMVLA